jgi:hypothetical protein
LAALAVHIAPFQKGKAPEEEQENIFGLSILYLISIICFPDEIVKRRFPTIPSMPVSADTASAIVRTLGGPPLPPEWRAALNLGDHPGGIGPGPTLLNFTYLVYIHTQHTPFIPFGILLSPYK